MCVSSEVTVVGSCRHISNNNHKIESIHPVERHFSRVSVGKHSLRRSGEESGRQSRRKKKQNKKPRSGLAVFSSFSVMRLLKQLWWAEKFRLNKRSFTDSLYNTQVPNPPALGWEVSSPPAAASLPFFLDSLTQCECVRWSVWCRKWTPCPWRSGARWRSLRGWRGSARRPARSCSAGAAAGLRSQPGTPPAQKKKKRKKKVGSGWETHTTKKKRSVAAEARPCQPALRCGERASWCQRRREQPGEVWGRCRQPQRFPSGSRCRMTAPTSGCVPESWAGKTPVGGKGGGGIRTF